MGFWLLFQKGSFLQYCTTWLSHYWHGSPWISNVTAIPWETWVLTNRLLRIWEDKLTSGQVATIQSRQIKFKSFIAWHSYFYRLMSKNRHLTKATSAAWLPMKDQHPAIESKSNWSLGSFNWSTAIQVQYKCSLFTLNNQLLLRMWRPWVHKQAAVVCQGAILWHGILLLTLYWLLAKRKRFALSKIWWYAKSWYWQEALWSLSSAAKKKESSVTILGAQKLSNQSNTTWCICTNKSQDSQNGNLTSCHDINVGQRDDSSFAWCVQAVYAWVLSPSLCFYECLYPLWLKVYDVVLSARFVSMNQLPCRIHRRRHCRSKILCYTVEVIQTQSKSCKHSHYCRQLKDEFHSYSNQEAWDYRSKAQSV